MLCFITNGIYFHQHNFCTDALHINYLLDIPAFLSSSGMFSRYSQYNSQYPWKKWEYHNKGIQLSLSYFVQGFAPQICSALGVFFGGLVNMFKISTVPLLQKYIKGSVTIQERHG
jgi:hypothetical protein